ncbi:MAG TPA: alkaline phosphatase D family protein [Gaiellaceae bacterium]|nr:alkaline phosphatase D family protein [Gaiellaceae bacterium]
MKAALAIAAALLLAGSATPATAPFAYGVAAGEVTATSALLWTRAPRTGNVTVELDGIGSTPVLSTTASASDDLAVAVAVRGLMPGTSYSYRFRQGNATSPAGRFRTAPRPTTAATVSFAISGDADATPGPNGRPAYNGFQVYARMAAERNDFNLVIGDTIYSDSEVGGSKVARTVREKWAKYRQNLSLAPLRTLRAAAGTYSHWDDHEFINDFSPDEHGTRIYDAGYKAFTDYSPVRTGAEGLYRTFRWGKHVELFFLDQRSFRSGKASVGGLCNVAGAPDLAPTAPPAVRQAFTLLVPTLAQPVPPACLEKVNDPARTMLGSRQLARFLRDVRRSTATFKVIVNETPLMQLFALPYDRWEGYAAERQKVVDALRGVKNVVVLTTDTHANLVGDVRLQTFTPSGPVASGITEVITGPVATNTFAKEVDAVLGREGVGAIVGAVFFKPQPPVGLGLPCVALDTYGYAQVAVTASRLTVRLKDLNAKPVRDVLGAACAPVVIPAK